MFGFLNIDKPAGCTSRDVVNRLQRLVRPAKVGHAGTLDPLATGVLVVALGPATRLIEYVQQMPKTYRGTFLLGRSSATEDIEGDVCELNDPPRPSIEELRRAAMHFVGDIWQQPPAFSALKVQGRRAYELARQGTDVRLEPRRVKIDALEILDYVYPELTLQVVCGGGTYIRSLGRDLARAVGTEAVMSGLVREAIGPFLRSSAIDAFDLDRHAISDALLPAHWALQPRRHVYVTDDECRRLSHGQPLMNRWNLPVEESEVVALTETDQLAAILMRRGADLFWPLKNFVAAE